MNNPAQHALQPTALCAAVELYRWATASRLYYKRPFWSKLSRVVAISVSYWQETNAMHDQQLLTRITLDPQVLAGKPVIRGTRLSVEYILNLLAHGASFDEILDEYQGLTQEDLQACLLFAAKSLESTTFMPLVAEPA